MSLTPTRAGNTRFSRNEAQTSGSSETMNVVVQSFYGLKKGTATTDQYDDRSLLECVRSAEELARLAPDDKETMPVLGPQTYLGEPHVLARRRGHHGDWRAKVAADAIAGAQGQEPRSRRASSTHQSLANVIATSKGLFGYEKEIGRRLLADRPRRQDDTGSGWGGGTGNRLTGFDTSSMTARAIDLAVRTQKPVALEPGNYTTILSRRVRGRPHARP